jgi:hypothetical protein
MKNLLIFLYQKWESEKCYYVIFELCSTARRSYKECSRYATTDWRQFGSRAVGKEFSLEELYNAFGRNCCLSWTLTVGDNHCQTENIKYTAILAWEVVEIGVDQLVHQLMQRQNY